MLSPKNPKTYQARSRMIPHRHRVEHEAFEAAAKLDSAACKTRVQ
jgi:hypothetical protein